MVTVFVRCKNSRILEKKLRHIQSTTKNNFLSAEYYRESSTAPNQSTRCGSDHYPNLKSKKKNKTQNIYENSANKYLSEKNRKSCFRVA